MTGVRPEPLTLEVALAHYTASLPEGKSVLLTDVASDFGCSVKDVEAALAAVARPRTPEICGRCAFISICPLHAEDEPWAG